MIASPRGGTRRACARVRAREKVVGVRDEPPRPGPITVTMARGVGALLACVRVGGEVLDVRGAPFTM